MTETEKIMLYVALSVGLVNSLLMIIRNSELAVDILKLKIFCMALSEGKQDKENV